MAQLKNKWLAGIQFDTDEEGKLKIFSDDQMKQFEAQRQAVKKYEDTIKLKQQIQDETNAIILENQKEIKKKSGTLMQIGGQIQTFATNPRNWAKGLFNAVTSNVQENIIGGGKAIGEQNAAINLYNQSKDLADQAAKIVKTDRPQAEALLKQSLALTEEANKFAQGEATKKIMGTDDKLTGTEIFAKSALTGLEIGSFLPVGTVVKGTGVLANVSTKVPATLQASKTVAVGNIITRGLGLGDIYQVGKVGTQKGFGKVMEQTIFGQAIKATPQALTYAGLGELADDDGVNNYWGSVGTNAIGAFGVTLGLGYGAKVLGSVAQAGVSDISKMAGRTAAGAVTDLAGALPMPPAPVKPVLEPQKLLPLPQEAIQATTIIDGKVVNLPPSAYTQPVLDRNVFEPKAQVIGTTTGEPLPNFFEKLGAFDPQETIPMVDITETIKGNNIDFNPDSVLSINATRKTIDDLALLTGNEVGGKQLKINFEDPKYKEVYNNMIKPLVDRINEVDANVKSATPKLVKSTEISAKQVVEIRSKLDTFKADEQKIAVQLDQDMMLVEAIIDELKTHPGKALHKYANKRERRLPEITGKGKSKYARQGDSLMTELGFESDDEAQAAYESFLKLKNQRESLKADIKESKSFLKDIAVEQKTLQKQLQELEVPIETLEPQYISSKDVQKIPIEDVEMEVNKIYSELENAGMNIVPEQVRLTPNIQAVDEKLAKGEIPTPEEFDKGMKEYVNSTGKTEIIDGVQEELRNPMRKSTYVEKLKKENPDLNIESVQYEAAIVKDLEEKAINLIETNFDEAGKIARNITKSSSPEQVKIAELYMEKLRELGKNDELAQILHRFGKASSQAGQWNGILRPNKIGSPEYAIKEAQKTRIDKLKPQIDKEVAKVKQEMSSVVIDQTMIFDILDNITCR